MNNLRPKRVKFWSRISREKSHEWVLVDGLDPSPVPPKAWKAFNKAFWNWKTQGKFFPLDELEAYQFAAAAMVRAAERVLGPDPDLYLARASLSTYLVSAAFKGLLKYKARVIAPTRGTYRALFDGARVPSDDALATYAEGRSDREWASPAATVLDIRAFVESLPGTHSCNRLDTLRLAADCVHSTLPKLDPDARHGLRCWLCAEGVWIDAARFYNPHGSVPGYVYRFKNLWAPAFRKACTWRW